MGIIQIIYIKKKEYTWFDQFCICYQKHPKILGPNPLEDESDQSYAIVLYEEYLALHPCQRGSSEARRRRGDGGSSQSNKP